MNWADFLSKFIDGMGIISGVLVTLATILGSIEVVFKPMNKWKQKRKEEIDFQIQLQKMMVDVNIHLEEAKIRDAKIDKLEEHIADHREDIKQSQEERMVLWNAVRVLSIAIREVIPDSKPDIRRSIDKSIDAMDKYANDHMRG